MKKRLCIPKALLKSLALDIKSLIHDNEGRLIILEVVEEIPYEIRDYILEGLASLFDEDLAIFFKLLREEYGEELEAICSRALTKYRMAGIDVDGISFFEGDFYKAYASLSRQTGRISLEVAWYNKAKDLTLECFYLAYDMEGIHSFFPVNDIPVKRYVSERREMLDMVELNFEEVCILLKEAYEINKKNMTRPAPGKFLYKKYLEFPVITNENTDYSITRKVSDWLMPRQLVNSLFYALKQRDYIYIESIIDRNELKSSVLYEVLNPALEPGNMLLEARANEVIFLREAVQVSAYMKVMTKAGFFRYDFEFTLKEDEDLKWKLNAVKASGQIKDKFYFDLDPAEVNFFCLVYEIEDINKLFDFLEEVRLIKVAGEIPHGIHLKLSSSEFEDDWDYGISFLEPAAADILINGDEFVVIGLDYEFLTEFADEIQVKARDTLVSKREYEVDLVTAYNYIQGEYASFEDVLVYGHEQSLPDGMRFLSARYLVKNRLKVREFLTNLADCSYNMGDACDVFYQFEGEAEEKSFLAEYLLDEEFLIVSVFGENDLSFLRANLARGLCNYLEFVGIEVRSEGIFAHLNSEVLKTYPELENVLKEAYLNKWVKSRLNVLKGMSPKEATQSIEGQVLLWDMFKRMRNNEGKRRFKKRGRMVSFKDYIDKLETRWKIE
ncbi:hypothetical protein [Thermosyntropha sp.]|uniref:hypothetical protein n=1 Tax=Thermosyntropha sp. TaxID=2740820 RepID=UPI0025F4950D|nr:hypothetical protein [Thermosyntropha sp.]MBO8158095.1 hypothetical protein [Thermosyntropha sp.]